MKFKELSSIKKIEDKGQFFFKFGILFLPSALLISSIFFLCSLIISFKINKDDFLKNKFNLPLFCCSGFLIISCIKNSIQFNNLKVYIESNDFIKHNISSSSLIIDLVNWIPLFVLFWASQFFLNTSQKRIIIAKYLIIGTVPVVISCIGQYWLDWNEKLSLFNGLIIWYQKDEFGKVMSGLFSNPNYTGFWLSMAWPFSYALFKDKKISKIKKIIAFILSISILYVTVMTNSRNALIGILVSSIILIGVKLIFLIIVSIGLIFLVNYTLPETFIQGWLIDFINPHLPKSLITKLTRFDLSNILNFPRINIWKVTIGNISKRFLFGWGATTFSTLYIINGGLHKELGISHSHNLFLELAHNYGSIAAIILFAFILNLFLRIFKIGLNNFLKTNNIDGAWIAASIVSLLFLMTDMPYYEGRISIIFWVLLSGIKCIGDEGARHINDKNYLKII